MVQSYLRYEHTRTFGVVASNSNVVWSPEPVERFSRYIGAGRATVAANEQVLTWDIKKGDLVSRWRDPNCTAEASVILQSGRNSDIFAVGYMDGSVRLWDSKTATILISLTGHRSAVTALTFNDSGDRLASGGQDAHIIIWDLIGEVGLYRLRGHKDEVTAIKFIREPGDEIDTLSGDGWLLSTGKDSFIKIWDLSTRHCVETHIAHHGECWALALTPDQQGCVTTGNNGEVKFWAINTTKFAGQANENPDYLHVCGSFSRMNKDRAVSVAVHPRGTFLAVHGTDKNVEIWRFGSRGGDSREHKWKRKMNESGQDILDSPENLSVKQDTFFHYVTLQAGARVRSIDWAIDSSRTEIQLLVACANNSLEYYSIERNDKKEGETPRYRKRHSVELPGHRSDIRALGLSSDDRMLASASQGLLKIWNVRTATCIRTLECGYATDCAFLPGDTIVVISTKAGDLELFDVPSCSVLERVQAHRGGAWSLNVHPDGKSLVTGGADKQAKFWNFGIFQEEIPGTKRTKPTLRLMLSRVLKVIDDILSVRFSPDGKYIAVALLNSTVKVFFTDTLKHHLNLYGHKLPVLGMDISADSKLLATCSADKNVKIWGLDFGDCHRSFFAHQDSVMQVVFEKNTHNFFSAGKDRLIKYWDGDAFENIMSIKGHYGEVWALVTGRVSNIIVSASHDKSICVWERTDDLIFIEEEREKELEELYESTLTAALVKESRPEVPAGGKQTIVASEKLIEALEVGIADLSQMNEWYTAKQSQPEIHMPPRDPLYMALGGIPAEKHVFQIVESIKPSHLQDALLLLPFDKTVILLTFVDIWTEKVREALCVK